MSQLDTPIDKVFLDLEKGSGKAPKQSKLQHTVVNWVFTLQLDEKNGFSIDAIRDKFVANSHFLSWCRWQREAAKTTGKPHLQGCFGLVKGMRFNSVLQLPFFAKDIGPGGCGVVGVHIDVCYVPPKAWDYCCKEDTAVNFGVDCWEHGSKPLGTGQGTRTDLEEVRDKVLAGASDFQILTEHVAVFARYPRFVATVRSSRKVDLLIKRRVILIYGPTRTGKSYSVRFVHPEGARGDPDAIWIPMGGANWFDKYCGQPIALFDDFKGARSKWELDVLLQVLDPYPFHGNVKQASVAFTAETIFFTTNYHPRKWYDWIEREEQWEALRERFDGVRVMHKTREYDNFTDLSGDAITEWWGRPFPTGALAPSSQPVGRPREHVNSQGHVIEIN